MTWENNESNVLSAFYEEISDLLLKNEWNNECLFLVRMKDCGEDMLVDMSEILFNELAFFRLMQDLDGWELLLSAAQLMRMNL